MSKNEDLDPLDVANVNEVLTQRFGRYDGHKYLRPAYYPDADVVVSALPDRAKGPVQFCASLFVTFGEGGWRCDGVGRTPREAVQDLHRILSGLK